MQQSAGTFGVIQEKHISLYKIFLMLGINKTQNVKHLLYIGHYKQHLT